MTVSRSVKHSRPVAQWCITTKNYVHPTDRYCRENYGSYRSEEQAKQAAESLIQFSQVVYVRELNNTRSFWVLNKKGIWKEVYRTIRKV